MNRFILLASIQLLVLASLSSAFDDKIAVIPDPDQDDEVAVKIPTRRSVPDPENKDDEDQVAVKIPSVREKRGIAIHPWQWNTHIWPNGDVPYDIALHYTQEERNTILSAMAAFTPVTCIRFRPRNPSDKYYLQINKYYKLERCFSYIGRQTSKWLFGTSEGNVETRMKLDPSCLKYNGRGTVIHELMHILGFYHEHQRDDRDPRVGGSASHYNYKIYPRVKSYYMGGYDADSIMHYNFRSVPWKSRSYFSSNDIAHINTLYKCSNRSFSRPTTSTQPTTTTTRESYDKKAIESNNLFRKRRLVN